MAKKGEIARESVKDTIISAFNATGNFVAFQDKKIYVTAKDGENGELLQFAIAMTMPKTPVAAAPTGASPDGNSDSVSVAGNAQATSTELAPEDRAKIEELKKKLGVIG